MNGAITRLILVFVVGSLLASVVPLLQSGAEAPLVGVLDRGKALVIYAGFFVVFMGVFFPAWPGQRRRATGVLPWGILAGYMLAFAAIPFVLTAYISGIHVRGLVSVCALCALVAAVPLVLIRWMPARGWAVVSFVAAVAFLVLPGSLLLFESVGRPVSEILRSFSPLDWLHRLARLRETPSAWPFVTLALGAWVLVLLPKGWVRWGPGKAVGALGILGVPWVLWAGGEAPVASAPVRIESVVGGHARAGLRTGLRVTTPAGGGWLTVTLAGDTWRLPRDGAVHDIALVPGPDSEHIEVAQGGSRERVAVPFRMVAPGMRFVAWLASATHPKPPELIASPARVLVTLDVAELPDVPGALEALDAMAIDTETWATRSATYRAALLEWVALGGRLVVVGAGEASARHRGLGVIDTCSSEALAEVLDRRPPHPRPSVHDAQLIRTFARPDWQEMDLSALLWFILAYHGAFLLAFLLPLCLDSRKSIGVYLASVGFVTLVIAALAWHVLGEIFLRDNQVYTQGITLAMASSDSEGPVISRQLLCFASMSQETRTLRFAKGTSLAVYRDGPGFTNGVLDRNRNDVALRDVPLDRRRGKVVVRVDQVFERSPLELRDEGEEIHVASVPGVEDPLGLRNAAVVSGVLVEGGRWVRGYVTRGRTLVPAPSDEEPSLPGDVQLLVRRMVGWLANPPARYLLVAFQGLGRPDTGSAYLWKRDLGGYVLFPLAPK